MWKQLYPVAQFLKDPKVSQKTKVWLELDFYPTLKAQDNPGWGGSTWSISRLFLAATSPEVLAIITEETLEGDDGRMPNHRYMLYVRYDKQLQKALLSRMHVWSSMQEGYFFIPERCWVNTRIKEVGIALKFGYQNDLRPPSYSDIEWVTLRF